MLRCSDTTKWSLADTNMQEEKRRVNGRPAWELKWSVCWQHMQIVWNRVSSRQLAKRSSGSKQKKTYIFIYIFFFRKKNIYAGSAYPWNAWQLSKTPIFQCVCTSLTRAWTFTVVDNDFSLSVSLSLEFFSQLSLSLHTVQLLGATRSSSTQFRCQITVVESNRQTSRVWLCNRSIQTFLCVREAPARFSVWLTQQREPVFDKQPDARISLGMPEKLLMLWTYLRLEFH